MSRTTIKPELAALAPASLTAFAGRHMTDDDDRQRAAAQRAYVSACRGDYDRARRTLSRADLAPTAADLRDNA